jgi:hypothetical protein
VWYGQEKGPGKFLKEGIVAFAIGSSFKSGGGYPEQSFVLPPLVVLGMAGYQAEI